MNLTLKNPAELVARLELVEPDRVLLVDSPPELASLVESARHGPKTTRQTTGDALRAVKDKHDAILVWREDRSGSRSVFENAIKRLEEGGAIWVVTALRKVRGPTTPAIHRLERSDLAKGFAKDGLANDREVRVSAWNVAYRFRNTGRGTGVQSPKGVRSHAEADSLDVGKELRGHAEEPS